MLSCDMARFSIRAEGLYDKTHEALIDLPDEAAAERAAIQVLAELQMNAADAGREGVRRVAVHDAGGKPVLDVTLTVFRPPPASPARRSARGRSA